MLVGRRLTQPTLFLPLLRGAVRAFWENGRMEMYRCVTPQRAGKWYPDLSAAQRQACVIGAGFVDPRNGRFVLYREAKLEVQDRI